MVKQMLWGYGVSLLTSESLYKANPENNKHCVKCIGLPSIFQWRKMPAVVNKYPVIVNNHLAA